MTGTPVSTVAKTFGIDKRTIEAGVERFGLTGAMEARAPVGGRGKKRPACRRTSPVVDAFIKTSIPQKRAGPLEYTASVVRANAAKKGLVIGATDRTINRRFNEFGYGRDDHPAEKEPCSRGLLLTSSKFFLHVENGDPLEIA